MKISATSALVLHWSSTNLWETPQAQAYCKKLDLSEADPLIKLFDEDENRWHLQGVTNRKFFMKKCASDFLKKYPNGQVILLGAGISPFSVEIGSLFPKSVLFDVDKFSLAEKEKTIAKNPPNIRFIECDISNIEELDRKLRESGFDLKMPTIVLMEGIIYYVPTSALFKIVKYSKLINAMFACDYLLQPSSVNLATRHVLTGVFEKISALVQIDHFKYYSDNEISELVKKAGYGKVQLINMKYVQKERTGSEAPFHSDDISWSRLLFAK